MSFKEKRRLKKEIRQRIYRDRDKGEKEAMVRQRLQALATLIFIALILAGVGLAILISGSKSRRAEQQTEPAAQPAERAFTVVLDAGHGFEDPGIALSADLTEADFCFSVASDIKGRLESAGCRVHMTRDAQGEKRTLSDQDRLSYAQAMAADVFISIHTCGKNGVYYSLISAATADSSRLAGCLSATPVPESEYEITKSKDFPAVRVSIPAPPAADEAAQTIAQGILQYKEEVESVNPSE